MTSKMTVAIAGITTIEVAAIYAGVPSKCIFLSAGVALLVGIGAYAAHLQQVRKMQ